MDFNNLNDYEVKQLIKRLKQPFNSIKFNKRLQEVLSSLLNQVLRNTNICDTNQCQYNLWDNWLVHKTV